LSRAALLALALALAACRPAPVPVEPPPPPASDAHCAEHGVQATLCARHNPALAAVFRARGDFCEEHGQALSFCPVHHPERGGRPATAASGGGDAPAEGLKLRLRTREVAGWAGISTAEVLERSVAPSLEVPARLGWDPRRVARPAPRQAGRLRALHVAPGSIVREGAPLGTLESAAVAVDAGELQAARTREASAEAELARLQRLGAAGLSAERERRDAEREQALARAERAAKEAALALAGRGAGASGRFELVAPLAGVVIEELARPGDVLEAGAPLLLLADPTVLQLELEVPEREAAKLRIGQPLLVRLEHDDVEREARLDWLSPAIDERARTVAGRARLPNPDGRLRANQRGRVRVELEARAPTLLVPVDALQEVDGVAFVFVERAPDLFEVRRVRSGARHERLVAVKGALAAGERVVTTGAFLLRTETMRDRIGAGCCDVEE